LFGRPGHGEHQGQHDDRRQHVAGVHSGFGVPAAEATTGRHEPGQFEPGAHQQSQLEQHQPAEVAEAEPATTHRADQPSNPE
jgi:hypothetical protein